jgi:hypothetical protein
VIAILAYTSYMSQPDEAPAISTKKIIEHAENAAGLHDFADSFEKGAVDIAQPSVTKIGGITEMRKIIALAEAHSVELIPHCAYFGPGNLASIHIVASLPTDTLLENIYANLEASPFGDAMTAKDALPDALNSKHEAPNARKQRRLRQSRVQMLEDESNGIKYRITR